MLVSITNILEKDNNMNECKRIDFNEYRVILDINKCEHKCEGILINKENRKYGTDIRIMDWGHGETYKNRFRILNCQMVGYTDDAKSVLIDARDIIVDYNKVYVDIDSILITCQNNKLEVHPEIGERQEIVIYHNISVSKLEENDVTNILNNTKNIKLGKNNITVEFIEDRAILQIQMKVKVYLGEELNKKIAEFKSILNYYFNICINNVNIYGKYIIGEVIISYDNEKQSILSEILDSLGFKLINNNIDNLNIGDIETLSKIKEYVINCKSYMDRHYILNRMICICDKICKEYLKNNSINNDYLKVDCLLDRESYIVTKTNKKQDSAKNYITNVNYYIHKFLDSNNNTNKLAHNYFIDMCNIRNRCTHELVELQISQRDIEHFYNLFEYIVIYINLNNNNELINNSIKSLIIINEIYSRIDKFEYSVMFVDDKVYVNIDDKAKIINDNNLEYLSINGNKTRVEVKGYSGQTYFKGEVYDSNHNNKGIEIRVIH